MDTKGVVIDDKTMEMLVEISEMDGTSLDTEIQKYIYYATEGRKKIAAMGEMSPTLKALCNLKLKCPENYDWKEDYADALCEKYCR